jgi:hypothetical protein
MMNDEYLPVMSTLVLNLDDTLVSRLASAAARSHKALPDWAAEQLGRLAGTFQQETEETVASPAQEQMRAALAGLTGIWKDRGTTDELMNLTRGED